MAQTLTRKTVLARWLAIIAAVSALASICANHETGGMKGTPIPVANVAACLIAAVLAAVLCRLYWRAWMAPFVSGIAGVFGIAGPPLGYGPYGGVIGLFVGTLVALLPLPVPTQTNQSL